MATTKPQQHQTQESDEQRVVAEEQEEEQWRQPSLSSYLGLSFSLFLALLPRNFCAVQSQSRELVPRLLHAEEQLRQMRSRRKEDSKANARVVEIFASHRQAWQNEERRLLQRLNSAAEEIERLRARVAELEQVEAESTARVEELERERDEIAVMGYGGGDGARVQEPDEEEEGEGGEEERRGYDDLGEVGGVEFEQIHQFLLHQRQIGSGLSSSEEFLGSSAAPKFWSEMPNPWQQDVHYESHEPMYQTKHFVSRRESPWKVDGELTGISSKLKLLEQELINLEKVGKSDQTKVPSLMRKQAKRYQSLSGKIDDLCRRMQASDPCDPNLSSEFRTQRQTEFLLEAFRLQQRASETGQKLMALHTEVGRSYYREDLGSEAKVTTRRSTESIRNNFKEIQRNLEIWLARIIGDLEGILSRDGASRVREYYISRYPFVQ